MNAELLVSAFRDRLKEERDTSALALAGLLRSGDQTGAIVKSGYIQGLEDSDTFLIDIIKKLNTGEYN